MADPSQAMVERGHWRRAIADMSEAEQIAIAHDERPITEVAAEYGIGISQVVRLRAMHRPPEMKALRPGQPTKYTKEKASNILNHFSQGANWKDACEAAGVSMWTAQDWLDSQKEFAQARARAHDLWGKARQAEIDAIADSETIDPKNKSIMIKSRQWQMERQLEEYRAKGAQAGATNITVNYLSLLEASSAAENSKVIEHEPAKPLRLKGKRKTA